MAGDSVQAAILAPQGGFQGADPAVEGGSNVDGGGLDVDGVPLEEVGATAPSSPELPAAVDIGDDLDPEAPEPLGGAPGRPSDALAVVEPPSATAIVVAPLPPKDPVEPARAFLVSYGAPRSRETAGESLDRLARLWGLPGWAAVPWGRLRAKHTMAARALIGIELDEKRWGVNTARLTLTMLKGVLTMARRLGHMTFEELADATDWPKVNGRAPERGRAASDDEIDRLWRYIDDELPGAYAALVRAIFAVGFGAGLRRTEIASLTVGSYKDGRLRWIGKGSKARDQLLPKWAGELVEAWLVERSRIDVKTVSLFFSIGRDGHVCDRKCDDRFIYGIVRSNIAAAGIEHISPHDMRRTFGTALLRTKPVAVVQRLMDHSQPTTTLKYDRTPKEQAEKAIDVLEVWRPRAR